MSARRFKAVAAFLAFGLALALPGDAAADPSGKKWQVPSGGVPFRVFAHSSINCAPNGSFGCSFNSHVLPAVLGGFARWNSSQIACPGGGTTRWSTHYLGTFTSPSGLAAVGNDGENRVLWLGGSQWQHGSQTLGLTTTLFYTSTGQIIDADMELNNDRVWKTGGNATYQVDIESIITHEAGHFLGLDHSAPTSAVMYAYYDANVGEIKRTLTAYDITDVCTMYPGSSGGTGTQGTLCTADSQCGSTAPSCRGAVGAASRICTKECSSDAQCPTGYTCQTSSPGGSTGKACLPPVGAPDLCKFCTAGSQCSTGQCVTTGTENFCTRSCMSDADCGAGYACVPGPSSDVCVPHGGVCPSPQCTSNAQCAVGYVCQGGMCTATGNPGDRCEVSVYCKPCSICIGTLAEAYCRPCCGTGGTDECQGCPNQACASGSQCYVVTGSTAQVCAPDEGATACQACDATTPCQAGYTCINGRCHTACNPSSPGACSACFDSGGGTGACACPDEIAATGQPCGQLATGLKVCTNGNVCVGQPKVCRTTCTLGTSSCAAGETCTSVDGQAVCVPSNEPGQRCSACQSGMCAPGFICVSGRCYEPCNVAAPACLTCVEVASGVGICACPDQLATGGQACGVVAGSVQACAQGYACVNGICRVQCDPSGTCGPGLTCTDFGNLKVCTPKGQEPPPDAGSPGGGGIPSLPDAGSGGRVNDAGCGCSGGAPGVVLWAALALLGLLPRRRHAGR